MSNPHDSVQQKVLALFSELAGERAARLAEPGAQQTRETLANALVLDVSEDDA